MKELILIITEDNWSEIIYGSWTKTEWKIYNDYTVEIKKEYEPNKVKTSNSKLTQLQYNSIIKNIELAKEINTKINACAGEAWSFTQLNKGNIIWKRNLDYIYGIKPLENITNILLS